MSIHQEKYQQLIQETGNDAVLIAVSKTKPAEDILALYQLGHRDFGENYVQELVEKYEALPKDIRWHFIGHLQSNKVKYITPFVYLIHGVDSESLLKEINKQAAKSNRIIDCLLQVHIAQEETKFGMDENELRHINPASFPHIRICGLMGMASFSNNMELVRNEFRQLKRLFNQLQEEYKNICPYFNTLSMGMSSDYHIAIQEGSNMIRVGSLIFGERNYHQ